MMMKERLVAAREHGVSRRLDRERKRLQPAQLMLYGAQSVGWGFKGRLEGLYADSVEWEVNAAGKGEVRLPDDHHLGQWCARHTEREKKNVMLRVEKDGARWTGLLENVTMEPDAHGRHTCVLTFLEDFEQLNHLPVLSNPLSIPEIQIPEPWQLLAPAIWNLKVLAMLNLGQAYSIISGLPDDPMDFESWLSQWDWRRWPIIVKPTPLLLDDSPSRYVAAETGQTYADVAVPILDDVRAMVVMRRWFEGDPDPWPGARLRMNGQIVMDIVDKSGWWEQTGTGGTLAHGIARTVLEVADDGVQEIRRAVDRPAVSDRYPVSGFLGVDPKVPAVCYRTTGKHATAKAEWSWSPATVGSVMVGGSSMPGVNETLSASTKLFFNLLGSFLLMPGFGSVADEFLGPIYKDRFMAWMRWKLNLRTMQLGHGHYIGAVRGGTQAYTLPALLEGRKAARETEEKEACTIQIEDGPFLVGDQGQGHYFIGDRIGYEVPDGTGRLDFGQVTKMRLSRTDSSPHQWEATVAEWPRRDFMDWAIGEISRMVGGLKKGGLL